MKKLLLVLLVALLFTGCSNNSSEESFSDSEDSECSSNHYNCDDFSSHAEAQRVYELCGGVDRDVHELDRDKDGSACETLP